MQGCLYTNLTVITILFKNNFGNYGSPSSNLERTFSEKYSFFFFFCLKTVVIKQDETSNINTISELVNKCLNVSASFLYK